jgi:hypothetical protein
MFAKGQSVAEVQRCAEDHDNVGSVDDRAAPKTSNNIIQKGLAFPRKQSASVTSSGRQANLGILPRRLDGRGGASVVAAEKRRRTEGDPDAQARNAGPSHIQAAARQPN